MIVRRSIVRPAARQLTVPFDAAEPATTAAVVVCPDCGRDVPNNAAALDHHRRLAHEATDVHPIVQE